MNRNSFLKFCLVAGTTLLLFVFSATSFGQINPALDSIRNAITEQHKMLARSNGRWIGEVTFWFAPDNPPITSTSMLTNHMDANGRFQISEMKETLPVQANRLLVYALRVMMQYGKCLHEPCYRIPLPGW